MSIAAEDNTNGKARSGETELGDNAETLIWEFGECPPEASCGRYGWSLRSIGFRRRGQKAHLSFLQIQVPEHFCRLFGDNG